ncbi:MAG: GNAT family N-acetyltransferase [Bacillota bacterium]
MEQKEIIRQIDDGANYYLRLLGDAPHMEYVDNGYYSIIRPMSGEKAISSVFNLRIDHLPTEELQQKVDEIKSLGLHTWWGLGLSERMLDAIWGNQRPQAPHDPADEESYMALLLGDKPEYPSNDHVIKVKMVGSPEDFRVWAEMANNVLHGGYPIMHPTNHYHLCVSGKMACYISYVEGMPAAVAAVMHNGEAATLEFVATLKEYRRRGLALAACRVAVEDAFDAGARIITLRALGLARKLYEVLRFRAYQPGL